jgi:hypothetical protein
MRDLAAWLAVVERRSVDCVLWVPAPFDNVRNMGILECGERIAAPEAIAVGGHVPGEDIDFEGGDGVSADLGSAVDGRDVEADGV